MPTHANKQVFGRPAFAGRSVSGYTMIELVMIIVLVGILAVVVVPQFSTSAFQARGFSDEVQSAARYAQKLAVASGCPVQLATTADGYALTQPAGPIVPPALCPTGAFTAAVRHPSRSEPYAGKPPSGVTLSLNAITFRADGSSTGGSINVGGRIFTVIESTGYVQED